MQVAVLTALQGLDLPHLFIKSLCAGTPLLQHHTEVGDIAECEQHAFTSDTDLSRILAESTRQAPEG